MEKDPEVLQEGGRIQQFCKRGERIQEFCKRGEGFRSSARGEKDPGVLQPEEFTGIL